MSPPISSGGDYRKPATMREREWCGMSGRKYAKKGRKGHPVESLGHSGCCLWCGENVVNELRLIPSHIHGWDKGEGGTLVYADVCRSCSAEVDRSAIEIGLATLPFHAKKRRRKSQPASQLTQLAFDLEGV